MKDSPIYQEWRQEIEEEVTQTERRTIALNLLQENIPLETIVRTTGLSLAQLQELQSQVEQN